MNKLLKTFLLAVLTISLAFTAAPTRAQESDLLSGQKHYYSTLFRGNGEAIVYAKIVLTNNNTQPQTEFEFEIPRATVSEFVAFQQTLPQTCAKFDYTKKPSVCIEYQDATYDNSSSYYRESSKATYDKITPEITGQTYKLKLPKPIEPNKSSALIFAYAAKGYVNNVLGKNYFNFETFRVNNRIQLAKVTVDVDADQILKDRPSKVNYNQSDSVTSTAATEGASLSSKSLDRVSSQVGSYGPIVKDAKNLAPGETFTVKGEYADSWFILYLGEITLGILVILAILFVIYLLSKWMKKNHTNNKPTNTTPSSNSEKSEAKTLADTPPNNRSSKLGFRESINPLVIGMGLVSAIIAVALIFSAEWLSDVFRIQNETIGLIVSIGIFVLAIVLIISPIIFIGAKNGWRALLVSIVSMALWLLVLAVLASLLFQDSSSNNNRYDEYPTSGPSIDSQ